MVYYSCEQAALHQFTLRRVAPADVGNLLRQPHPQRYVNTVQCMAQRRIAIALRFALS